MASHLFHDHRQTLYCGCQYEQNRIDLDSCGMESAAAIKRAHRLEWEHIFAAEMFGRFLPCWNEPLCEANGKPYKGRRCCQKIDPVFRHMESELYNLWPAVGLVNQVRSNYQYGSIDNEQDFYGCAFKVDKQGHRAEPPDNAKGIVARATLFFAEHYGIPLSEEQRELFNTWNQKFPPQAWEKEWAKQVGLIEGYNNPYIISG